MQKFVSIMLTFILVCSLFGNVWGASTTLAAADGKANSASIPTITDAKEILEPGYAERIKEWKDIQPVPETKVVISPSKDPANGKLKVSQKNSFDYKEETLHWDQGAQVTVQLNVPETGLYEVAFDYYILDPTVLKTEGYLKVNDVYPYFESRRILFPNLWKSVQNDKGRFDRYGNELLPKSEKVQTWQTVFAQDASYFYMDPLKFKLNKGSNTLTLVNTRGDMLLGQITVQSPAKIDSYETYAKNLPKDNASNDKTLVITEAENMLYKNESSIRPISEQEPSLTPYQIDKLLLNTLDGFSWLKGGQSATWEIDVPQSGIYSLALKYKQTWIMDMPSFRKIEIDGKVPFAELDDYPFQYTKSWSNEVLGTKDAPYRFYLEKGKHTLRMTVNLTQLRPLAQDITAIMKEISDLSLEIKKMTGNKKDANRDWTIKDFMPDIDVTMKKWADQLEQRYKQLATLNPSVKEISELTNLKMSFDQLRKLAADPDQLPNRMTLFSDGATSVAQLLGKLLMDISESPMALDRIYAYQNAQLPASHAGFFENTWDSVKRFFLSFTSRNYDASTKEKGELNVWVNHPRKFVEIMQKMIDNQYTPNSGIRVKLSIMPEQNKLTLASASGHSPDVALGVGNWIPNDLAIRGTLLDLSRFEDFNQVAKHFAKGAMIPFAFEDGVYALPETFDFWVTFYRKDIFDALKLPVPDTWDDVVKILPELQRLGMNFYDPIAFYRSSKPFNTTSPFIFQFGGELFKDDGMTTAVDSEQAINGMKFMTDLFTIYNLPTEVPNFYNHFRYGKIPVGISDFQTYIQLRIAAPEIANGWKITPHIGVKQPDGTVARWASTGGETAVIFNTTKMPDESWDFLKWWESTDVQVEYANTLQTTFGESYLWSTANLDAFKQLTWPEEDKKVILEQAKWIRESSRVPGSYMVEREISNVWNKVVFDGANARTTLDDSIITMNREISRKLEEFGYVKDGQKVKSFPVPTITTIDKWVNR